MPRNRPRRTPGRPYCEAFPMLDVHEALRAAANGQAYIQWIDEDGLVTGFASIQEITDASIRLFYRLHGTRNVQRATGQLDIKLQWGKGGKYWRKPGFVCPCCRKHGSVA